MPRVPLWSLALLAASIVPALAQGRLVQDRLVTDTFAQAKQPAKAAPSTSDTRYFTSLNDVMDGEADIILKETRQGGRVTAASLDMCYPASPNSDRKERFVLDLTVNGQSLTGTTQTMRDKLPVTVNLTQRGTQGKFEFKGRISAGQVVAEVTSTENSDVNEQEYKESALPDENIVAAPKDFTEVSPESLAVKLKLDAVADFVKSLRGESIELSLDSLAVTCSELRSGEQVIYLSVNPDRAAALVSKMKSAPGVVAVGWTDGSFEIDRTLRIAAAPWSEGGKIDRDKLATEISNVLSKALSAKSSSFKWDDASGKLILTLKRPYAVMPALDLTDSMEFTAMVSPEKPGVTDRLILWLSNPTTTTIDETAGPKLNLYNATSGDEEGADIDDGGSIDALARALKAERWNSTKSAWQ